MGVEMRIPRQGMAGSFDFSLRRVVAEFMDATVEYERTWRWSAVGSDSCEWVVFEMLSLNEFRISYPLQGGVYVRCDMHEHAIDAQIKYGLARLAVIAAERSLRIRTGIPPTSTTELNALSAGYLRRQHPGEYKPFIEQEVLSLMAEMAQ